MSIATEVSRLQDAKAAIKAAIEGKGVTVPDGTLLDGMASLIAAIEAGGGSVKMTKGSITFAENIPINSSSTYIVQHDLGVTPDLFLFIFRVDGYKGYSKYTIVADIFVQHTLWDNYCTEFKIICASESSTVTENAALRKEENSKDNLSLTSETVTIKYMYISSNATFSKSQFLKAGTYDWWAFKFE